MCAYQLLHSKINIMRRSSFANAISWILAVRLYFCTYSSFMKNVRFDSFSCVEQTHFVCKKCVRYCIYLNINQRSIHGDPLISPIGGNLYSLVRTCLLNEVSLFSMEKLVWDRFWSAANAFSDTIKKKHFVVEMNGSHYEDPTIHFNERCTDSHDHIQIFNNTFVNFEHDCIFH